MIDTSAFDNRKNKLGVPDPRRVDISAFGYEYATPEDLSKPVQNTLKKPQTFDEQKVIIDRDSARGVTISQAPKETGFLKSIGNILRNILPDIPEQALFGNPTDNRFKETGSGALDFFYSGINKTDMKKYDDRVKKLTQYGIPEERASDIAWKHVTGQEFDATPLEEKVLRKTSFFESGERFLDSLDLVPMVGLLSKGTRLSLKTLAKLKDAAKIDSELVKLFPKLDNETRQIAVRKITTESTEDGVQRILADMVKDGAARADNATPLVRKLETDEVMPATEIRNQVKAAPVPARATRVAEDPLMTEARKYKSPDEFVTSRSKEKGKLEDSLYKEWFKKDGENPKYKIKSEKVINTGGKQEIEKLFRIYKNDPNYEMRQVGRNLPDSFNTGINNPKYEIVKKFDATDFQTAGKDRDAYIKQRLTDYWTKANQPDTTTTTKSPIQGADNAIDDTPETIRDMVRRDQTTLRPTAAFGGEATNARNLKEEIKANVAKYNEKMPDVDIAKIRADNLLGEESLDEIILRKRGIITDAEAIERAKRIRGTLEDVIALPKGATTTKEQYTAIEQIVQNEREVNAALKNMIDHGGMTGGTAERQALARLGDDLEELPEDELLIRALQESTLNLKKAEVVLLGIRAEAGRTLGGMKKIAEGVDARLRLLFNRINSNKKFTPLEKQSLTEHIVKLDTADNEKFLKALDELSKPDIFDKVAEYSVAAKLWNPTTHIVNLGGNTLRTLVDMGITTLANPRAARADMAGALKGLKGGVKSGMRALTDEGYAANLAKYVETGGKAPAIGGKLGKWIRTPFRFLGASDEVFKQIAYQRKLYRDAYRMAAKEGNKGPQLERRMEELLNNPTLKMLEDATEEAKHLTFQDDMGEITRAIDNLRDPSSKKTKPGKAAAVIARAFLPFLKTPVNLFKQAVDFSPLGIPKNVEKLKKARAAGDNETIAKVVGESLFGTAIMMYMLAEAAEGNLTGGAPKDKGERDKFYREKKLPYAIKIGDKWYEYKRIDPFATLMGLTADIATLNEDEKTVGGLIGIIADNLKDKTYLSGVSDLMNLLTGDDWERSAAFKSMVLGASLPSIIGHTARSVDPKIRVADGLTERIQSQIPGLSDDLPARVDVLGYDQERANKGLNYFFNPIQSKTAAIDPVTKELMKIDKTISVPNDYFTREKVEYKLTPKEYEQFAKQTGLRLRKELVNLFKTPRYKVADEEEKSKLIDDLRKEIQDEWKDEYIGKRGKKRSLKDIFGQRPSLEEIFNA